MIASRAQVMTEAEVTASASARRRQAVEQFPHLRFQGLGSHEDVHLRERARVAERQIRAAMAAQPAK
jgi:hypothetical protein